MELNRFVAETLVEIVDGVVKAQEATTESGAQVNPANAKAAAGDIYDRATENGYISRVDFEVALTSAEGTEGKGGIGVMFCGIGIGGNEKTDTRNVSVTNVRFSIPVIFPKSGEMKPRKEPICHTYQF